jgi:hypothetical protein
MEMGVMGRPAVARRWCIEDVVVIGGGGLRWNDGWVLGCDGDERKMGGGGSDTAGGENEGDKGDLKGSREG